MTTTLGEFYRGLELASRALAAAGAGTSAATRAAAVHEGLTAHLADTSLHAALACRSGCAHCCHYPVGVTFAEAARLIASLDTEATARLHAEATATADLTWRQLVGRPCPLLRDGACSAYAARPLPCRALGSTDAAACAAALAGGPPPPRDEVAWWRGLGAAAALAAGRPPEQPAGSRELRAAVAAMLGAAPELRAAAFAAARAVPAD